jgi:integrase
MDVHRVAESELESAPGSLIEFLGVAMDRHLVEEVARASKRKLSPAKIERLEVTTKGPKLFGDGGGLWLQVTPTGGRSWVFRYSFGGRALNMGLGSASDVAITEARGRAIICRRLLREGLDPVAERERSASTSQQKRIEEGRQTVTISDAVARYIETHRPNDGVRREPHRWGYNLTKALGARSDLSISKVDADEVEALLAPIWKAKPETAKKARRELAQVLDFAKAKRWRRGDNPARDVGQIRETLGKTVDRVASHHDAMPYADLPAFWADLKRREEVAALALQWTILTCARTSETTGAVWSEIDLDDKLWAIPAERMKGGVPHRVPLTDAALAILTAVRPMGDGFIFPGARGGQPLSRASQDAVLKRMGRKDGVTVHGFRSTFSDWAWEVMNDRDVASAALAHVVGDRVERAYRRSDALQKRRALMEAWTSYVGGAV